MLTSLQSYRQTIARPRKSKITLFSSSANPFNITEGERMYNASIISVFRDEKVFYWTQVTMVSGKDKFKLAFRYSEIKRFHNYILDKYKHLVCFLPELPPTRSFLFINRTNQDQNKIEKRRRELQLYLQMLLNNPVLIKEKEVEQRLLSGGWCVQGKDQFMQYQEPVNPSEVKAASLFVRKD